MHMTLFQQAQSADLPDQTGDGEAYPPVVPGRTAHIDADFLCYETTALTARELKYLERTVDDPEADKRPLDDESVPRCWQDMKHNADLAIENLRKRAAAEFYVCHLTPEGSSKGGRGRTAVLKEYQAQRAGEKPPRLHDMRAYIASAHNGVEHMSQEADDGMCQASWQAHLDGREELCIVVSRDKDLWMVGGNYHDFKTGENGFLPWDEAYGSIWLVREKYPTGKNKPAQLRGRGTAYFWAQCLMGDPVDNISGLPAGINPDTGKKVTCGAVKAHDLLKDAKSDVEAREIVTKAWREWPVPYTHWCDGETPVKWYEAMLGDMRSLWMRREKGQDVTDWLKTLA